MINFNRFLGCTDIAFHREIKAGGSFEGVMFYSHLHNQIARVLFAHNLDIVGFSHERSGNGPHKIIFHKNNRVYHIHREYDVVKHINSCVKSHNASLLINEVLDISDEYEAHINLLAVGYISCVIRSSRVSYIVDKVLFSRNPNLLAICSFPSDGSANIHFIIMCKDGTLEINKSPSCDMAYDTVTKLVMPHITRL